MGIYTNIRDYFKAVQPPENLTPEQAFAQSLRNVNFKYSYHAEKWFDKFFRGFHTSLTENKGLFPNDTNFEAEIAKDIIDEDELANGAEKLIHLRYYPYRYIPTEYKHAYQSPEYSNLVYYTREERRALKKVHDLLQKKINDNEWYYNRLGFIYAAFCFAAAFTAIQLFLSPVTLIPFLLGVLALVVPTALVGITVATLLMRPFKHLTFNNEHPDLQEACTVVAALPRIKATLDRVDGLEQHVDHTPSQQDVVDVAVSLVRFSPPPLNDPENPFNLQEPANPTLGIPPPVQRPRSASTHMKTD